MKKLIKILNFSLICLFTRSNLIETNKVEISYPIEHARNSTAYEFVPIATIIGFSFTIVCLLLLAIAKLMFTSSDQYMMNNRYDLVIFKPPTKHSAIGPRRGYKNSDANTNNLNAASACGFDLTTLTKRSSLNSPIRLTDLITEQKPND